MPKAPKQPKQSKEELARLIEQQQKVEYSKKVALRVFPSVEDLKTVYDGQTAFNAVSGHIQYALVQAQRKLKVYDPMEHIDLKTGKDSDVKQAVISIFSLIQNEPAEDMQQLLDLMGRKLSEFLSQKHLKDPMSTVTAEEFIAK